MNTTEVKAMFVSYADEADQTFLTDAQTNLYLVQGYNDFRDAICNVDPFIYSTTFLFELTEDKIDLTTTTPQLLGEAALAGSKLQRIVNLARISDLTNNNVIQYLNAAPSQATLDSLQYCLDGSTIFFRGLTGGAFRLEYVPFHANDFSGVVSTYIDDMDSFHEMIALYAYRRYAIRDGADNMQVIRELQSKELALKQFLQDGRNHQAARYVSDYYDQWV